jgi:hypothetical protein
VGLLSDTLPHGLVCGQCEQLTTCPQFDRRTVVPYRRFQTAATSCACSIRHQDGRRFTDIMRMKRIFTDAFSLENIGFDMSNGTIFRLPLEDESMARNSELSDQTIDRLYARFPPDIFYCLLLLPLIQLKGIDNCIDKLVNSRVMMTTLLIEDPEERNNFVMCLRKSSADVSNRSLQICDIRSDRSSSG